MDSNRLSKLQENFIEEDTTTDQDLTPKSKPKSLSLKYWDKEKKT